MVEEMNKSGKINKNLVDPPLKDNVAVPDAGFTILRFVADNVGYWLFHCHMSWHSHLGMGLVIKVLLCHFYKINLKIFCFGKCIWSFYIDIFLNCFLL